MRIYGQEFNSPRGWIFWAKHHAVSVAFIILGFAGVLFFLWGKSSVVIMDTQGPREYKAGVRVLGQYTFDSMYTYKDPVTYQLICADGVKLLVIQEGYQVVNLGVCE